MPNEGAPRYTLHLLPIPGTDDPLATSGTLDEAAARDWLDRLGYWAPFTSLGEFYTVLDNRPAEADWSLDESVGFLGTDVLELAAAAWRVVRDGEPVRVEREDGAVPDAHLARIVRAVVDDRGELPWGPAVQLLDFLTRRIAAAAAIQTGEEASA